MAGFFLTIYLVNNIHKFLFNLTVSIKKSLIRPKPNEINSFDINKVSSSELDYKDLKRIAHEFDLEHRCQRDLFSFIFNSGANSAFLTVSTMILIEYIHNKYELSIPESIFYCVSVAVIIIFGASYRYSQVVAKECLELLDSRRVSDWHVLYHSNSEKTKKDLVCIWTCFFEKEKNEKKIECKFISSKYSANLNNIIEFYASKHMKLETTPLPQPADNKEENKDDTTKKLDTTEDKEQVVEKENYNLLWPDYYDIGLVSSNKIKAIGFKLAATWNEFNLFPGIKFKMNSFSNQNLNKKIN